MSLHVATDLQLPDEAVTQTFAILAKRGVGKTYTASVLHEPDEFGPQRPMGEEARMLGAIEDLVRRGRARGIGVTMITQRPAVLNKNVLTQIEVLVAMRLTSPQDRAAIAEWIKYHADSAEAQKMLESLGSLPIGTAWFWSPGWLNLFQRVAIRKRETFDSSSTPEVGANVVKAGTMAAVDIEWLRKQLAATIAKVAAADPKVLKARIVTLERELRSKQTEMQKLINEESVTRVEQVAVIIPGKENELVTAANRLIHEMEKHAALAVAGPENDLDHAFNVAEQRRSAPAGPIKPSHQKVSSRPTPLTSPTQNG